MMTPRNTENIINANDIIEVIDDIISRIRADVKAKKLDKMNSQM